VLCIGVACLQLFVQQNWTGPLIDPKTIEYLPAKYNSQYKVNMQKLKMTIKKNFPFSFGQKPKCCRSNRNVTEARLQTKIISASGQNWN